MLGTIVQIGFCLATVIWIVYEWRSCSPKKENSPNPSDAGQRASNSSNDKSLVAKSGKWKHVVAIVGLIVVCYLGFTTCSGMNSTSKSNIDDFIGTWKLAGEQYEGDSYHSVYEYVPNGEEPPRNEITITEDKKMYWCENGTTKQYSWSQTKAGIEAANIEFYVFNGRLTYSLNGDSKYYSKVRSSTEGSKSTPSSESVSTGNSIPWSEASSYIGKRETFHGKVVDCEFAQSSKGKPTFIDIGAAYPDTSRLTIVIWGENRDRFPFDPEKEYAGKSITVTGKVYMYDDACCIEVDDPGQIVVNR